MPNGHFPQPAYRKPPRRDPKLVERNAEIWAMRVRGMQPSEIAEIFGLSTPTVHKIIQDAGSRVELENAPTIIKFELSRLDALLATALEVLERRHLAVSPKGSLIIDPTADGYDPEDPATHTKFLEDSKPVLEAIDTVLKIMKRRAELLGLDAPKRTEHAVNLTQTDATDLAIQDLISSAKAQMDQGLAKMREEIQSSLHNEPDPTTGEVSDDDEPW